MREQLQKFFLSANGWTSGQYSLYRICLGAHLLLVSILERSSLDSLGTALSNAIAVGGSFFSVLLILGLHDNTAAYLLAALWALRFGVIPWDPASTEPFLVILLLAHIELPRGGFGTFDFRLDPKNAAAWKFPQPVVALIALFSAAFYTIIGFAGLFHLSYPGPLAVLLFSPLGLLPRFRPYLWVLQLFAALFFVILNGHYSLPLLLNQIFLFDPNWIPRLAKSNTQEKRDLLFYDGECGLCHRTVTFVISEEGSEQTFDFAPIRGETFERTFQKSEQDTLPDSIIVVTSSGEKLLKSKAALYIGQRLGGIWTFLARLLGFFPSSLLDIGYDFIASIRKRIFKTPETSCPLLPKEWQGRFLP